jgi:hypothetical protein
VKVIRMCQNIVETLDLRVCINFFSGFRFISSAAYETGGLGRGFEGIGLGKGIPCRSYTKSMNLNSQGSQ